MHVIVFPTSNAEHTVPYCLSCLPDFCIHRHALQALAELRANLNAEEAACSKMLLSTFRGNAERKVSLGRIVQLWPFFPNTLRIAQIGMYPIHVSEERA